MPYECPKCKGHKFVVNVKRECQWLCDSELSPYDETDSETIFPEEIECKRCGYFDEIDAFVVNKKER